MEETRIVSLLSGGIGFYHGAVGMIGMLKKYAPTYEHMLMIEGYKYTDEAKEYLESIGWVLNDVKALRSKWTNFAAKRWPNTFTKINLWNLPFNKVIYLDLDAVPLKEIKLLDTATADLHFCVSVFPNKGYRFRSGLMVLRPNQQIYEDLIQMLKLDPSENGAKLGDQGLLNIYFKDNFHPLHNKYHAVEKVPRNVVVRHLRPKPWASRVPRKQKHYQEWLTEYNKLKPPKFQICTDPKYANIH